MRKYAGAGMLVLGLITTMAACNDQDPTNPSPFLYPNFDLVGRCPAAPTTDQNGFELVFAPDNRVDRNNDGWICEHRALTGQSRIQLTYLDNNVPSVGACSEGLKLVLKDEAPAADLNGNGTVCKSNSDVEEAVIYEDDAS